MRTVVSSSGNAETLRRALNAIQRRGLTVFAEIDHAAAAQAVGIELAAEEVVLFGNPRAGTPLMREDPRIGIELPLRLLVWNAGDKTMLGYNDPREIAAAYDVGTQSATLDAMASLLDAIAHEAAAEA